MSVQVDVRPGKKAKSKSKKGKMAKKHSLFGDIKVPKELFANSGKVYRFVRRCQATTISQVALAEALGSFQFTLNAVQGYTEFTTLFDAYRIAFVEVVFTPVYNMAAVVATTTMITPNLYTAIDLDDNSSPGSIGAMEEYSTCRMTRFDKTQSRSFKPFAAVAKYQGAFSGFGMSDGWNDCNSPANQYYGLKYGIEAGVTGQTQLQVWKVNFLIYLEFKFSR